MNKFLFQSKMNMLRQLIRKPLSVIFALIFPVFFYILYTKIFTFPLPEAALKIWNIDYLLAMIIYGVLITAISNTAGALLEDHLNHFDLFVDLSPAPKWQYYLSMILIYFPFYLFLMIMLGGVAFFINNVQLGMGQWLGLVVIIIGSLIPFSLFGIIISFVGNTTGVNILSNLISFPLAILGGLWWPIETMPEWLQVIGRMLPSYFAANLGRKWVYEGLVDGYSILGLIIWSLSLILVLVIIRLILKRREPQLI